MEKILHTEIEALLKWKKKTSLNLEFGDFSCEPSEEIVDSLKKLAGKRKSVLGVDIFRYSKMEPHRQLLVPFVLNRLLQGCSGLLNGAKYLFQKNKMEEIADLRIDTGDGFFLIFETPLHAVLFSTTFEALVRFYNSFSFLPEARAIVGPLDYRISLTTDLVNLIEFQGERKNWYGKGIINCARILSRDKLNRFLMDRNTFEWFMVNMKGVENVPLVDLNQLKCLPDFLEYDERLIDSENAIIGTENGATREYGIKGIDALKLFETQEKEDRLELYCVQVKAAIRIHSASDSKSRLVYVTVGNLNTEGITF